jgi:hypothetical protein
MFRLSKDKSSFHVIIRSRGSHGRMGHLGGVRVMLARRINYHQPQACTNHQYYLPHDPHHFTQGTDSHTPPSAALPSRCVVSLSNQQQHAQDLFTGRLGLLLPKLLSSGTTQPKATPKATLALSGSRILGLGPPHPPDKLAQELPAPATDSTPLQDRGALAQRVADQSPGTVLIIPPPV